jgi:hypothetical protein
VIDWIAKNSPPLTDLADAPVMRGVLGALRLRLDGEAAASETFKRKRKVLVNALNYAMELGEFEKIPSMRFPCRSRQGLPLSIRALWPTRSRPAT